MTKITFYLYAISAIFSFLFGLVEPKNFWANPASGEGNSKEFCDWKINNMIHSMPAEYESRKVWNFICCLVAEQESLQEKETWNQG